MTTLSTRPRLRALIDRLSRLAPPAPAASAAPATPGDPTSAAAPTEPEASSVRDHEPQGPAPVDDPARFARDLHPGLLAVERCTVTSRLYERLDEDDVAAVEQLLRDAPGAWQHYDEAEDEAVRRHVLLALGMWLGSEQVIEKTGLVRAEPPEDVHSMTRGAMTAAGGLYEADLVVDGLLAVGCKMSDVRDALDFGCSSGRVVRPLAAAYPDTHWRGCDPNERAIAWADETLPGIDFFVSDNEPPLALDDGSLDLVYAISIWSHFEPALGLRWFEEMRRVLRPGGHLVWTTHGLTSVAHYAALGHRTPQQSRGDRRRAVPRRRLVRGGVRRGGGLGSRERRLGHDLPQPGVGAHATLPALARSGVRPRAKPGQPGRIHPSASLTIERRSRRGPGC